MNKSYEKVLAWMNHWFRCCPFDALRNAVLRTWVFAVASSALDSTKNRWRKQNTALVGHTEDTKGTSTRKNTVHCGSAYQVS